MTSISVNRDHSTILGIDLGGARGKTTAVAEVVRDGAGNAEVRSVRTRAAGGAPWTDEALLDRIDAVGDSSLIAINAPLTSPACQRCTLAVCPGVSVCDVPSVRWLRTSAQTMGRERIGEQVMATTTAFVSTPIPTRGDSKPRLLPYAHRGTEAYLHFERGVLPRDTMGRANGQIGARGNHLRRRLAQKGVLLNQRVLEVSPRATIHVLLGETLARRYKRDADPWETRAAIVEALAGDLRFARTSCFSREEVLRNDHCFDALLSAYTGYLWLRDKWERPSGTDDLVDDGWIWAPPETR